MSNWVCNVTFLRVFFFRNFFLYSVLSFKSGETLFYSQILETLIVFFTVEPLLKGLRHGDFCPNCPKINDRQLNQCSTLSLNI